MNAVDVPIHLVTLYFENSIKNLILTIECNYTNITLNDPYNNDL